MNASSSSQIAARPHGAFPAIFAAGLLAGVLDITAAFITWAPQGVPPVRILQGIASGLLGPQAFKEGTPSALLGGAIHFLIAFSAAAVFYVASRKIDFMTRRPILAGVLYGVCVYLVMYWIVMPLAKMHPRAHAHALHRRDRHAHGLRGPADFADGAPVFGRALAMPSCRSGSASGAASSPSSDSRNDRA